MREGEEGTKEGYPSQPLRPSSRSSGEGGRARRGERPTRCDALVKLVPHGASFMPAGYRSSSETFFSIIKRGLPLKFEGTVLHSFAL